MGKVMVMISLVLTLSTALSGGCSTISNANQISVSKENAVEIIEKAASNYDFGDYLELNSDKKESLLKQKILEYNEENNLVDREYICALEENLKKDKTFTYFENVDNFFIKKDISESLLKKSDTLNSELVYNLSHVTTNDRISLKDNRINSSITKINHDYGDIGSGSTTKSSKNGNGTADGNNDSNKTENLNPLSIHDFNQSYVSSTANGTLDGVFFLGIMVSRDACIIFYNMIAKFLNNQVMYSASGTKSPVKLVIEALKALAPVTMATVTAMLVSYFAGIWNTFISMFSAAAGPIGWIVGAIIALIGGACIAALAVMFIMGYQKKGFAVGWKVHSLFNWEWYCGETI